MNLSYEPYFTRRQEATVGGVGTVIRVMGGEAVVELRPSGACGSCGAIHACFLGADVARRATVRDPIGVRVGDIVEITLQADALVKASFIVYIVPLIALFLGVFLGQHLRGALGWSLSEDVAGIVFGFAFLVVALLCIKGLNPRLERSGDYTPTITRIIPRVEGDLCPAGALAGKEDQ